MATKLRCSSLSKATFSGNQAGKGSSASGMGFGVESGLQERMPMARAQINIWKYGFIDHLPDISHNVLLSVPGFG